MNFNPTLVRLKLGTGFFVILMYKYFNPTLVRLKLTQRTQISQQ